LSAWHQRYLQQTSWTNQIREYLFNLINFHKNDQILEVGSGTGALLSQIAKKYPYPQYGIDINRSVLKFSKQTTTNAQFVQADGYYLPFPSCCFGLAICHYLFLWLDRPGKMLSEMRRVTRPGGAVIALAEPDHQSRIDYPPPLDRLGQLQTQSLKQQGMDVQIGRRLGNLFHSCGFKGIKTGILGALWSAKNNHANDNTEWMTLKADLAGQLSSEEFAQYQNIDQHAREIGERVLFIPTFYAIGFVE
jgi:ubiquinone/menaquinone biosynthesis C-methylase UbiE